MVDMSKIRSDWESPYHAFEELICQLARREGFAGRYHRIEGSGGDGGVEAYWLLANGDIVGYQAKYFLKTKDIDWSQIDKSVKQALETYPKLTRYIVAFACDLTGKRGKNAQGKSGWETWETYIAKWKNWANDNETQVSFEPWTASDINDRLVLPNAEGLRQFWFGEDEFNEKWVKEKLKNSLSSLGERYHPEDHVNVRSQEILPGLVRSKELYNEIDELRSPEKIDFPSSPTPPKGEDYKKLYDLRESAKKQLANLKTFSIVKPINECLPIKELEILLQETSEEIAKVSDWCREKNNNYASYKDIPYDLRKFHEEIYELESNIENFRRFLSDVKIEADKTRFIFVAGSAGAGKSHLLAFLAEKFSSEGKPVLFFNGHDFHDGEVIHQIVTLSNSNSGSDEFFQTLNCAGETHATRSLIIIDAINEGRGTQFWYNQLPKLQSYLQNFPHIACIISCRSEYQEYAVPKHLLDKITHIEVFGFATTEEQEEACKVYLDKRKILRPSTPWLNPEFTNPLFLRSAVITLEKEGKNEFPKGLRGMSELFRFYIETTSKHLTSRYAGTEELVGYVSKTINSLAEKMLTAKNASVSFSEASKIIEECFVDKVRPEKETWLETLIRNGLLQKYPVYQPDLDPLSPPEEIITFSFERLKDHLIAKQLIEKITDPVEAFGEGGCAEFIINEPSGAYHWSGLITALSIMFPEKFGKELIDCLPDGLQKWWGFSFAQGFAESVRWRDYNSFTGRTRELLSALDDQNVSSLSLVLEVGLSEEHPFNAINLLSPILEKRKMPERDAFWSYRLCNEGNDEEFAIHRVIDWALDGASNLKGSEALKYASIILTWAFSTSNRVIRDNATKALTAIFLIDSSLFSMLADKFNKTDDLYILERLYASAYGAICQKSTSIKASEYSETAYQYIFSSGEPPLNLKLRGYAKGIIDYAEAHNDLPSGIDLSLTSPPYKSEPPQFRIEKEELEKLAEKVDGGEILGSCVWDDFGIYEIDPHTRVFLNVPLTELPPITLEEKYKLFKAKVFDEIPERKEALKHLESSVQSMRMMSLLSFKKGDKEKTEKDVEQALDRISREQRKVLELLNDQEKEDFKQIAIPHLNGERSRELPRFDLEQLQLWVAKKAYGYGWTKKLFPNDRSNPNISRERNTIERIGKKYQWLALSELQCRIADNYWLRESYSEVKSKAYETPLDLGFERDIDPTILYPGKILAEKENGLLACLMGDEIDIGECEEDKLQAWPLLKNPSDEIERLVFREDSTGREYVVFYEHRSTTENYPKDEEARMMHGFRRQEFRFFSAVFLSEEQVDAFFEHFEKEESMDIHNFTADEHVNEAYLLESPWAKVWRKPKWSENFYGELNDFNIAKPIDEYHWESHLDKSMPEGCSAYIPSSWLQVELGLSLQKSKNITFFDDKNEPIFLSGRGLDGGTAVFCEKQVIKKYLEKGKLRCIWMYLSERSSWPNGDNKKFKGLRIEGLACWNKDGSIRKLVWDHKR